MQLEVAIHVKVNFGRPITNSGLSEGNELDEPPEALETYKCCKLEGRTGRAPVMPALAARLEVQ